MSQEIHPLVDGARASLSLPTYSYAFQPIVDLVDRRVVSYEALVRGPQGQSAGSVFAAVPSGGMHAFDEQSRAYAVGVFAKLSLETQLNLNFLPRSLDSSPTALSSTVDAARRHGVSLERLVIEITEDEVIDDHRRFAELINEYRRTGLRIAIDDFGAGYAGLNLLANFQPDIVKLDLNLIRGIDHSGPRQAIVRATAQACVDLGIDVIAEGVETQEEYRWIRDEGLHLCQGYLFAKPGFESLPQPRFPT